MNNRQILVTRDNYKFIAPPGWDGRYAIPGADQSPDAQDQRYSLWHGDSIPIISRSGEWVSSEVDGQSVYEGALILLIDPVAFEHLFGFTLEPGASKLINVMVGD